MNNEIQELREMIFDLFSQGTYQRKLDKDGKTESYDYDHMCISSYENAQEKLIEWGMIKESECSRK